MSLWKTILLSIYCIFYSLSSWAQVGDRLCRLINYACGRGGGGHTGHSYPASSDAHGSNPASIPTDKSPFGLEVLSGDGEWNFGAFQGHGKFGMAAGSITKENAFFSNASNLAAANIELPGGTGGDLNKSNYNFGLAFPILKNKLKKWMIPYIGVGVRRYKESGHIRGAYGIALAGENLHFGLGVAFNDENVAVGSLNGGIRLGRLSFDFTTIKNWEGIANKTDIYSILYIWKKVSLIGALRKQEIQHLSLNDRIIINNYNMQGKKYHENHLFLGVQFHVGRVFSLGYYINYVLEKGGFLGGRVTFGAF